MSVRYQYENLLRKPVEYRSATIYFIASMIMLFVPHLFFMPKSIAFSGALVLLIRSSIRFYHGYKLQEYQLFLPRLGSFKIPAKPLQRVKQAQWIGLGFLWDGRHTQRLFDLEKPENRHLISQRSTLNAKTKNSLKSLCFVFIKRALPRLYQQRNELPLPAGGGKPEIHAVGLWEGERDIGIYFSEQIGHSLILGQPKTGKSNLLEIELIQSIARKDAILLLDIKGSPSIFKRAYQQATEQKFPLFLIGDCSSSIYFTVIWSYQLLKFPLKEENTSSKERSFIFRYIVLLAEITQKLGYTHDSLITESLSPHKYLLQELQNYVQINDTLDNLSTKELLLHYYQSPQLHTNYYSAIYELLLIPTSQLANLLNKHRSFIKELLNSSITKQAFQNQQKVEFKNLFPINGGLAYFNLKQFATNEILTTYINVIEEELIELANINSNFRPLIIADELANTLQEESIPLIDTINQIKARLSLYEPDIPRISKQLSEQNSAADYFLSLFNQLIILRSANQFICDYLMQRQKDVYVTTTDLISGASDNSNIHSDIKFSSSTTVRQTKQKTHLLSLHDFASLPIGQAFCLLEGNQLYKIRIPLVEYNNSIQMDNEANLLIDSLEKTYHPTKTQPSHRKLQQLKKNENNSDNNANAGITSMLSSPDHFID